MTKPYAIVLDCDMPMLHWEKGFIKYFNEQTGSDFEYRPFYQNIANLVGFAREDLEKYIDEFNHTEGFKDLDTIPGCQLFLDTLNLFNDKVGVEYQVELFIVTKCGSDENIQEAREKNLQKLGLYPGMYDITYLNIDESKKGALEEISETHEILMFVDDYTSNCDVGYELDIPTYCLKTFHNEHLKRRKNYLTWRDNMYEMTEELVQILGEL